MSMKMVTLVLSVNTKEVPLRGDFYQMDYRSENVFV